MNQTIKIERVRKGLSSLGGLLFFDGLMKRFNLINKVQPALPSYLAKKQLIPKEKFLCGIFSFLAGAECIDDMKDLREESLFFELTKGGLSPTSMHNFLSQFKLKHFEKLQELLPKIAFEFREKMFGRSDKVIITMDATPHEQSGQQMEGVEWDYKSRWCYSSQNAFDEKGFCYGWNLLTGSSHSSQGAVEMIEKIFKAIPKDRERFFRADSAYGTHKIYNALITNKVNFAICLKEGVWGVLLNRNEGKMKWKKTKLQFFDSKKCQVSSTIYAPKKLQGKSFLRVVFIRAPRKKFDKEDKRAFRHYAIITDMSSAQMSDEEIIKFYRMRSNAENFIKDLKNGLDFKHFPCGKMNKNKAWGLMGIFAYNLLRWSSFLIDKKRGCFIKRVRRRLIYIGAEIRKGQRKLRVRFSDYFFKEVKRVDEKINVLFMQVYKSSGFKT